MGLGCNGLAYDQVAMGFPLPYAEVIPRNCPYGQIKIGKETYINGRNLLIDLAAWGGYSFTAVLTTREIMNRRKQ